MRPMVDDGRGGSCIHDDNEATGLHGSSSLVCVNSSQPESAMVHALEALEDPSGSDRCTVLGGLSSGSLMVWRLEGDSLSHVGTIGSLIKCLILDSYIRYRN